MNITRDLVATVRGPGWSYGLSRVLIDDAGNGAVFTPPGMVPVQTFKVVEVNANGGTGETDDGEEVKFRRRGASCSYKLAKCQTKTDTLKVRWQQWLVS